MGSAHPTGSLDPDTRTKSKIAIKDAMRSAAEKAATQVFSIVNGFVGLTDDLRIDLGLTVRAHARPVNPPSDGPVITVTNQSAYSVDLEARSTDAGVKKKPRGAQSVRWYSFVGATPSNDVTSWFFQGATSGLKTTISFSSSLAAGTKVWFIAQWASPRQETSSPSAAISTNLSGGIVLGSESMKIAA